MPLQVDASLVYELGRPIKRSDIDTLNSLYNTYKNKALPPTPISNPGLISLAAAVYPEKVIIYTIFQGVPIRLLFFHYI